MSAKASSKNEYYDDTSFNMLTSMSGSSVSVPFISGAAALVRQYFSMGYYPYQSRSSNSIKPSSALLRAVIINSARNLTDGVVNCQSGYGVPILKNGLGFGTQGVRFLNDVEIETNGHHVYKVTTNRVDNFSVTMTYTDLPTDTNSYKPLVTDIDLIVEDQDGNIYTGNSLPSNIDEEFTTSEKVFIKNAKPGTYTIHIYCSDTIVDDPKYSLALAAGFDQSDVNQNPTTLTKGDTSKCPGSCLKGQCINGKCVCSGRSRGRYCQTVSNEGELKKGQFVISTARNPIWYHYSVLTYDAVVKLSFQAVSELDDSRIVAVFSKSRKPIVEEGKLIPVETRQNQMKINLGDVKEFWIGFYTVSSEDLPCYFFVDVEYPMRTPMPTQSFSATPKPIISTETSEVDDYTSTTEVSEEILEPTPAMTPRRTFTMSPLPTASPVPSRTLHQSRTVLPTKAIDESPFHTFTMDPSPTRSIQLTPIPTGIQTKEQTPARTIKINHDSNENNGDDNDDNTSPKSVGIISGVTLGSIIIIAVAIGFILYLKNRRINNESDSMSSIKLESSDQSEKPFGFMDSDTEQTSTNDMFFNRYQY